MATQQEIIKGFIKTLDTTNKSGTAAVDAAIKACSNFDSLQDVIENMISDCRNSNSADTFLRKYCGINLDNRDTGAITGADAGGSKIKTTESIVPESGELKDFTGQSFIVNGLTLTLEENFDSLSDEEQFIWQGLYTWWAKSALELVKKSYGYSFNDSDVTFKKVTVKFVDDPTTTWLAWNHWYDSDSDGKVDKVTLNINMNNYKNIDTANPNGYSSSALINLDKTLAHEFTHTLMYAKVNNSYELSSVIKEGIAELTIGIDDERQSDITYLAKNPSALSDNLNGTSSVYDYAAGYMLFRYFAKQASTRGKNFYGTTPNKSIVGGANEDTLSTSADKVTLIGGNGNDSITNYGGSNVKILGGDGADQIYSYGSKTSINTGTGDDYVYLYSDASNVTVTASSGNNELYSAAQKALIKAGNGNDFIHIYSNATKNTVSAGSGNDTIKNSSTNVSINAGAGNDKIYNYASGKVTISGGNGADTITNWGGAASMVGGTGNDVIWGDAGKDTIRGGSGNDKLHGEAGNDKIYGDSGNDSLWGGTGKDVFIYKPGEGTDRIFDYESGDMLKILKADGSEGGSFKSSKFSGGDLTLTINGGGEVIFDGVSSGDKFNINGKTYTLSGRKLK